MASEKAQEILNQITDVWQVDEEDLELVEDGFDWWPGHHRVTVRCKQQDDPEASEAWRVVITTEFIRESKLDDPKVTGLLVSMSKIAPTYAWVFVPPELRKKYELAHDGRVHFHSSVYVRPETSGWLPGFIARLALMQPIDAERLGDPAFAGMVGGVGDLSGPRLGRQGQSLDEILHVAEHLIAPAGQEACRWEGSNEFEEIAEHFGQSDICFGLGGPEGLTLETPFGTSSALIRLHHDIPHPALGNGLLSTIQLPVFDSVDATTETCMWLNYFASISWTDAPVLGSWHPKEVHEGTFSPAYGALVPNALYSPGIATNMALWSLGLARWAKQALWPDLQDLSMQEVLAARLGGASEVC